MTQIGVGRESFTDIRSTAVARSHERATANSGPLPISYLTLALPAADFSAAATDDGSAKAITASPAGV
jgi:hypothetical protein